MNAVQVLMAEHRVIESVLAALTAYARSVANGRDMPRADLVELVSFLQDYADAFHHGKEEDILFRAMADQGMPVDGGPLGVMLAEHAEGRRLTSSLSEISAGEGGWSKEQRRRLLFDATSFARLLNEHIQKEDRVLYPMATQMLPDDVWRKIEVGFADFQSARQRADQVEHFEQLAERLVGRYVADYEAS